MEQEIIARTIDDLGRIHLPTEFRRAVNWAIRDDINVCIEGDTIILSLAKHNGGQIAIDPSAWLNDE